MNFVQTLHKVFPQFCGFLPRVLQIHRMVLAQCSSSKQNPKKVGRSSANPHFVFAIILITMIIVINCDLLRKGYVYSRSNRAERLRCAILLVAEFVSSPRQILFFAGSALRQINFLKKHLLMKHP